MRAVPWTLACATSVFAAAALVSGCVHEPAPTQQPPAWTARDRDSWYYLTQGSRMIPYAWFQALEQAGSTALFGDERHLLSYGYIPAGANRPNRLPIGFAIDRQPDDRLKVTRLRWYDGQVGDRTETAEPWLGLNCAACHTAELRYRGQPLRIDGGPGMGDLDALVEALDAALVATRTDPAKWNRFAQKVLRGKDTPENRQMLRAALDRLISWQQRTAALNHSPLRAGYARVDAFGHIYNKVALFAAGDNPVSIVNPADAPVSYPFLWGIHRQEKVQWNGVAKNARIGSFDYGAMGRNTGEVLGVFGELVPAPAQAGQPPRGYWSSIHPVNLERLEQLIPRLRAPAWPAAFPPVDQARAERGRVLFAQQCASCHKTPDLQVAGRPTEVMVPFDSARPENRTDIWMACNALLYEARTGLLRGTRESFFAGEPLPAVAPVGTMLATSVKGALLGKAGQVVAAATGNFLGVGRRPQVFQGDVAAMTPEQMREARRATCTSTDHELLAYKARPLDGIWATAPYLHNGSVPTLYHLLLPAEQRPRSFHLGTRDYDPRHVGYDWRPAAPGNRFLFEAFAGGSPMDGNANVGHDYGSRAMSEQQRWDLVEYMKTL